MTFVLPAMLAGLALTAIPVVLHLITRQKPRPMRFPALRFLKQRQRVTRRRLRLRQILLLLMRMLLVALMALALARPKLYSEGSGIVGEQPIAAVLVIDTSPSMEYAVAGRSRLDEAKQRASELLADLPEGSRATVIDSGEPAGTWSPSLSAARERLAALTIRQANRPVTDGIAAAYRLLAELERDTEEREKREPLSRAVYVFSDRTEASWDASRFSDLKRLREPLEASGVREVLVDVGVESPIDLAVFDVEVVPAAVAANQPAKFRVTVRATGQDFDTELLFRFDGGAEVERKPVRLTAGTSEVIEFDRRDLTPGVHQVEITLATPDALAFDNSRFATVEVRGPRAVLVVADDPIDAGPWQKALLLGGRFTSKVIPTAEARTLTLDEIRGYQVVTLVSVARPNDGNAALWELLQRYVEAGGHLAVLPGGEELSLPDYNDAAGAKRLLPARFGKLIDAPQAGVEWEWGTYQHPMLQPFKAWALRGDVDFVRFPPRAFRYWQTQPTEAVPVVRYTDAEKRPAVLERPPEAARPGRGRVLLFTTPFDARRDVNQNPWSDYLQTSFFLVLANQVVSYLAGDMDEVVLNFTTGQTPTILLPVSPRFPTYTLSGPGIGGTDSLVQRAADVGELRTPQARTAGNYLLTGGTKREWVGGFSVNVPASESVLDRVPAERIEGLFGDGTVLSAGSRDEPLAAKIKGKFRQPVELFPWLMLGLLLLLTLENLLANRFYRRDPDSETGPDAGPTAESRESRDGR